MPNRDLNKHSRRINPVSEGRVLVFGTGLLVTLIAAAALFWPPQLLRFLDLRVYDLLLSAAVDPAPSEVPVLVGIDEASLEAYGQWPWPRYRMAQLVNGLTAAGAEAIALDMLMPEADRTSPEMILRERQRDLGTEDAGALAGLVGLISNDERLAAALVDAPVVVSYKFLFSENGRAVPAVELPPLDNLVVQLAPGDKASLWPQPTSVLTSLNHFVRSAKTAGFTNVRPDDDGVLRRIPLLIEYRDGYYPGLAFAAVLQANGRSQLSLQRGFHESFLQWNDRQVPLDEQGRLLLNFYCLKRPFPFFSAADVLAGNLPQDALAGRLVFVGAWAAGLGDRHVTPMSSSTPGLAVHAVIASNLLQGVFLHEPFWARGAALFFVLFVGIVSTLLITRYGFFADLLLMLVGSAIPIGGALLLLKTHGLYISPVTPVLLLLANCGLLGLVKYGVEMRKVFVRTRDLVTAQDTTILGMVFLSEARDEETGEHILRTQRYVETLARHLANTDKYRGELTEEDIELFFKSAPLHDIGKVGIPDRILLKPGKLTEQEYEIMKTHPLIGARALANTMSPEAGTHGVAYLDYAKDVAIAHHEKWDGSGYPKGLAGDDIPLAGRLMALADVYDALISKRVYKPAYPHEKARAMILEGRGKHFDPDVVDAFVARERDFIRIAERFRDSTAGH